MNRASPLARFRALGIPRVRDRSNIEAIGTGRAQLGGCRERLGTQIEPKANDTRTPVMPRRAIESSQYLTCPFPIRLSSRLQHDFGKSSGRRNYVRVNAEL